MNRSRSFRRGATPTAVGLLPMAVLVAILLAAVCSCSGKHGASVSGRVELSGELLSSGTVTFFPVDKGPAVYGLIGSDGRYTLSTGGERSLAPGDYQVTVVATDNPPAQPGETPAVGRLITPPRYGRREETGLRFTVQPGANQINIQLTP